MPQRVRVADQDRAAAGLQHALGLEGLDHPAGIAAADPEQRRQLLMGQRHEVSPSVRSIAETIHFAVRCSIEWIALQAVDWKICASMQSA